MFYPSHQEYMCLEQNGKLKKKIEFFFKIHILSFKKFTLICFNGKIIAQKVLHNVSSCPMANLMGGPAPIRFACFV